MAASDLSLLPFDLALCYVPSMTPDQLRQRIETLGPNTQVEVTDLTGTMDHYQVQIVSPAFQGLMMLEQHRKVMSILQAEIDSGEVHALSMKTFTPEQFERAKMRG